MALAFGCGDDYELLICERCGRERVRPVEGKAIVRCDCGGDEFRLYDLAPIARDPEERWALTEEASCA